MTGGATATRRTPGWLVAAVAGLFGLFYAFAVWNGVGQLITQVSFFSEAGLSLSVTGWAVWLLTIILPIAVFAAGVAVGRSRGIGRLALLLFAGLAVVAVFWLDVIAYATANQSAFVAV